MADYINPMDKKAYPERAVQKVKSLMSDLSRLVDDGKVSEARNKFQHRMGPQSNHTGFNRLNPDMRRLARMVFRDIVGDQPKDVNERRTRLQDAAKKSKIGAKAAGGGGMMTPDDVVRRGRRSLFKQE